MLDQLPDELILEIASYLNFYVKQTLVKTCRKLNKLLYNTILFEEFRIPEKHNDKVIDLFISGQLDSSKVKKLDINYVNENDAKRYYQLLTLFPKLKVLCKEEHKEYGWTLYLDDIRLRHDALKDKQQQHQLCIRKFTIAMLENHTFNHITHLCLEPTIRTQTEDIHIDFFRCLSNATSLKSLQIEKFHINLQFLERLHRANPGIKSLILKYTFIELNDHHNSQELTIEPNCQLESFKLLYITRFCDKKCLLIPYMVKKYPNLKTLDMYSWVRSSYPNAWDDDAVETYTIYSLCIHDLLSHLTPQLDTFKFEPQLFGKLITQNDKKVHLKRLVLYQSSSSRYTTTTFEKDNSLLYIQSLDVLTSVSLNVEEWTRAMSLLSDQKIEITLPNIKRFHLFQRYSHFSETRTIEIILDRLLAIFCQLESLRVVGNAFMITSTDHATTVTYPQLVKLALGGKQIQPNIIDFIKHSLPNVTELYWESEVYPVKFDLPRHHLRLFNLCIFDTPNMYNHSMATWKIHYHVTRTDSGHSRDLYYSKKSKRDHKVTEIDDDHENYQAFVKVDIICRNILQLVDDTIVIF